MCVHVYILYIVVHFQGSLGACSVNRARYDASGVESRVETRPA